MNTNILAVLIQEGSRLVSGFLKSRTPQTNHTTPESLKNFLNESYAHLESLNSPPEPESAPAIQINVKQTETPSLETVLETKATEIATGCVPCAMGHFGTCTGILNESLRFAHGQNGLADPEVIDRVNMCMDELNAMERVDLRPEMIVQLNGWEKDLAEKTLTESRNIRHKLEGIQTLEDLEQAAAVTQSTRQNIGRQWFQSKMANLSVDDKEEIHRRVMEKIEEMATAPEE